MRLAGSFALLCTVLPAQTPEVVARYTRVGERAVVTSDDLAFELVQRYGGTEQGKATVAFLIDLALVRQAATARGLMPNRAETNAWIADLEERLTAAGMSLATLMAEKGMTREAFREYATLQLAHERMVRDALELGPGDEVTATLLNLWLEEARQRTSILVEREQLTREEVARVGGESITGLELGRALARTATPEERLRFVQQIVLRELIEAEAERAGITVTAEEMARDVEARRREAAANPAYGGVPFEQLLEAQGTTVEELARSPVLRAQILERKLIAKLTGGEVRRRLAEEREAVLARHGARRRLSLIALARAEDAAADDNAMARLTQIRERIAREMPFAEAARAYSEDPRGRIAGGDVGWHNRVGSELPAEVIDAAFAMEVGDLSEPVATDAGFYLIRLDGIEPTPSEDLLAERVRQQLMQEQREAMIAAANLEIVS